MTLLQTLILAIVQGVTEFLPVSSSGHLFLVNKLFGIEKPSLFFEIVLHVGTLVAVLIYYRQDIMSVIRDSFKAVRLVARGEGRQALSLDGIHLSIMVVAASIPTAIIGLGLNKYVDPDSPTAFVSFRIVAIALMINGLILLGLQRVLNLKRLEEERRATLLEEPEEMALQPKPGRGFHQGLQIRALTWWRATVIGLIQGCAVFPGISRSGSTITAGLGVGLENSEATRFSFLISIPTIVGAFLLKLIELDLETLSTEDLSLYFLGAIVSGVVGYFALSILVELVKKVEIRIFGYYCLAVSLFLLIFVKGA